ncbi:MAG: TRAM domain-containing protein [Alphaproteobacteria bacterium]
MTRRKSGAIVELEVDALGAGGDGMAAHDGKRFFIPYTLPGDRVRARVSGRRGEALAADVVERLADGPGRVTPPCGHFGVCGGCALQHLDDEFYGEWKRQRVVTALARRGLGEIAVETVARTLPGVRRRATLLAVRHKSDTAMGFRAPSSNRVVPLTECPVLDAALVALLAPLDRLFTALIEPGQWAEAELTMVATGIDLVIAAPREPDLAQRERVAMFAAEHDLARISWRLPDDLDPELMVQRRPAQVTFGGIAVDLPVGAFLQPSAQGEALLVAEVTAALADATRVADLYAGCGAFTFALAGSASVRAVEGVAAMADAITGAAGRAGLADKVTADSRDLERLPLLADELTGYDAVVFDPPRAGARRQAEALAVSAVPVVVAVSCHPGSFARDARALVDGGYVLERVLPVDQFLWSPHVELVAVFRRP